MNLPINSIICDWQNCYDDGWQGVIVPEAFSHPAKMSYGLLKRILSHAKEQDWLKEGDVILDPFGGIGSTGILGAYEGYQVVCVELEWKFVDLAIDNFVLHENAWEKLGCPLPIMIHGDSRRLCELVEKADCIVSSPPFQEGLAKEKPEFTAGRERGKYINRAANSDYGQTPGQLGAMKPGKVDMVVSSPPYAESLDASPGEKSAFQKTKTGITRPHYTNSEGNLGNLKSGDVDCVISSPPFEKQQKGGGISAAQQGKSNYPIDISFRSIGSKNQGYQTIGESKGQLGQEQGDTFWSAAKTIVQQCHQILKPGGVAIWVVKAFVRKGAIVDFPGDWKRLCESVGFVTLCEHHAMLIKETKEQSLFGQTITIKKERKSFFRRLAESKGSPPIDFENVICTRKVKDVNETI